MSGDDPDTEGGVDDKSGLSSGHDSEASDEGRPASAPSDVDRSRLPARSERRVNLRADAQTGASDSTPNDTERGQGDGTHDADHIASIVLARLQETHFHLPIQPPNPTDLAELKSADHEAYSLWLRMIEERNRHDMAMESAEQAEPGMIVRRGQNRGLLAVLLVLLLAGYALYLNHATTAGVIAGIDIVALAAVFAKPHTD